MFKNKDTALEIIRLKNRIKKKHRNLRLGMNETDRLINTQFTPLIKEFKKHLLFLKRDEIEKKYDLGEEIFQYNNPELDPIMLKTSSIDSNTIVGEKEIINKTQPINVRFIDSPVIAETETEAPPLLTQVLSTPKGQTDSEKFINDNFKHPLTRKFMLKFMKDTAKNRTIDHTFGPRIEEDSIWAGDKLVQFTDEGEIRIDCVNYKGTPGLYELLFKRLPDDEIYDQTDLLAYKDICLRSNCHKRNYDSNAQINRNNSLKYRNIIEKLFPPKTTHRGKGLLFNLTKSVLPIEFHAINKDFISKYNN